MLLAKLKKVTTKVKNKLLAIVSFSRPSFPSGNRKPPTLSVGTSLTSVWFFLECVGTFLNNEKYGDTLISFFGSIIFFLLGYTQFRGLENLYRILFGVLFLEMK